MDCLFCNPEREIVGSNESAYAIRDAYPVSQGHTLVFPRTHESNLTALDVTSYGDCFDLVKFVVAELTDLFYPAGFNIGINIGEAAGQTINHAHIHVIPRYENDVPNPRGGVIRAATPGGTNLAKILQTLDIKSIRLASLKYYWLFPSSSA